MPAARPLPKDMRWMKKLKHWAAHFAGAVNTANPAARISTSHGISAGRLLHQVQFTGLGQERYRALKAGADACIGCGECEERCPYNLPIRQMLAEAAARLG